jgi:hypothetical protein
MADRIFIGFVDNEQRHVLINLALIRHASFRKEGDDTICALMFSESHTIELHGQPAVIIMDRLMERGLALNGEPLSFADGSSTR